MTRHVAQFRITGEMIRQALHMPEGTLIYNIRRSETYPDVFEFFVEHDDLPEIPEGGKATDVTPFSRQYQGENGETLIRWEWGLR